MSESVQKDRFDTEFKFMSSLYHVIGKFDEQIPKYDGKTRFRDKALLKFSRSENLISGVISGAVSRDKNRGWSLIGNKRQVSKYSKLMHNMHNGMGWRQFVSLNSYSWYSTNLGYASEIGRDKNKNPLTMWSLDPTRLELTSVPEKPLIYYPQRAKKVYLKPDDYIHGNSMPSIEEEFNYSGLCALERAIQFVRLMLGLNQYNLEKLGVAPPKGILLGKGISQNSYNDAIKMHEEWKNNNDTSSYEGVLPFFTTNTEAGFDLISFSTLPDNFNLKEFVDIIMQVFSLAFGFPVGEFWSIASGSFGRTGEMNVQQEQAVSKGEADFALSFQEQLQTKFLPSALSFNFDNRNDKGELVKVEIDKEKAQSIINMYEAGLRYGQEPLINKEEARKLLAFSGVIPKEWVDELQDEKLTDLQSQRERVFGNESLVRMMIRYPNDPIIEYVWNPIHDNPQFDRYINGGQYRILWESGNEALRRKIF